jgi:hypothetical protein
LITANTTFDAASRQAFAPCLRLDRPGPKLQLAVLKRTVAARYGTGATKRAFAALEINLRKSRLDRDDAVGQTGHKRRNGYRPE